MKSIHTIVSAFLVLFIAVFASASYYFVLHPKPIDQDEQSPYSWDQELIDQPRQVSFYDGCEQSYDDQMRISRQQGDNVAGKVDDALVQESRNFLIESGFSSTYFDEHFKLLSVTADEYNEIVLWQLCVSDYPVTINDTQYLKQTGVPGSGWEHFKNFDYSNPPHDINQLLPKETIQQLANQCIGTADIVAWYYSEGKLLAQANALKNEMARVGDPIVTAIINLETGACQRIDGTKDPVFYDSENSD